MVGIVPVCASKAGFLIGRRECWSAIAAPVWDGSLWWGEMFPCIRPGNSYLVFDQGAPKLAQGTLCLALQGIGPDEANSLELLQEEDCLLRQLAGNGCCANRGLVFLLAAVLSL